MDHLNTIHSSLTNTLASQNSNTNLYRDAPTYPTVEIKTTPSNLKQFNIVGGGEQKIISECKKLYYSGKLKRKDMKDLINFLK